MKTNFYFIRHGETESNAKKIWQGSQGISCLSEKGKTAVRNLAKQVDTLCLEILFSSNLLRAVQTAKILSCHCDIPIKIKKEFAEVNFGDAEGKTLEDVQKQYPEVAELWFNPRMDRFDNHFPDGETVWEVLERVFTVLNTIYDYQCKKGYEEWNIGIVSHAGVITSLMAAVGVESPRVDNCDVVLISRDETGYKFEKKLFEK